MAGYWLGAGNNNPIYLNQSMQTNNMGQYNVPSATNPLLPGLANDINTARALLAASIPPASGAFLTQPQGVTSSVTKTKSVITLPPSLVKKRQDIQGGVNASSDVSVSAMDLNVSNQGSSLLSTPSTSRNFDRSQYVLDNVVNAVNFLSSNSQSSASSVDVAAAQCDEKVAEDTATPVFSSEISRGKEFPVSKPDVQIIVDPMRMQNRLLPHGSHRILYDNDHWHKFVITGPVTHNREKILKRILEFCEPTLLLPTMYQEESSDTAFFYARNCGSAVERLIRLNNLIFELDGSKFIVKIHLQCALVNKLRLNSIAILRKILERRYDKLERCLDLSNFEHDSDLLSYMFCPLSQPSILHWVLTTAVQYPINFSKLLLCYNGLRQLKMEVLIKASYLRTLDLSHNELLYLNDLKDLVDLTQVTKLILDGNPLCAEFKTSEDYISKMKSLMPQLKSLDSVSLFSGGIAVPKEKNFLCSKAGHQMVDQFLRHFFDRYDWTDRRCLDGLYHDNALFSLTCLLLSGQSTSQNSSLTWYVPYNRNLKKISDYSKAESMLFHGPDQILELFTSLPATEHDPYSFCVDLLHYNDKAAVVSVAGVFREHPTLPPDVDHMRSFRRVFSLTCTAPNEWQIINEQLHISNLTTEQAEHSFKIKRPTIEAPVAAWLVQDAQLLSDMEKDQMASIMMQLTTLNKEWATRFLKESHWYVREALIAFVNKFEAKTVPEEAFSRES